MSESLNVIIAKSAFLYKKVHYEVDNSYFIKVSFGYSQIRLSAQVRDRNKRALNLSVQISGVNIYNQIETGPKFLEQLTGTVHLTGLDCVTMNPSTCLLPSIHVGFSSTI
ncbi:hypothetical protein RF11_05652 [Thelohanellus kitauei]|uniref:Uncharacterized protein n=1 Tax=Thelohanellus kitauei TaxID=669202 RepID=A0A0C2J7H6_THEKT|nr:hypothetical protein RF11_05652 [Thelohanellus kitauei]